MFNACLVYVALLLTTVHLFIKEVQSDVLTDGYIPCEEGWFFFGGKCYKTFGGSMEPHGRLTWEQASKRCEYHGGHLATIQSNEVQEFIVAFQLLDAGEDTWIGLNDRQREGEYVWVDGTAYSYTNWKPREPSGNENKDCVKMLLQVQVGKPGNWKDFNCTEESPYICEVDMGKQSKKSWNPTRCSAAKGMDWKYGESCYSVIKESMTWEDAERYCQNKFKGHLLTILNFKMDYFLKYILADFTADIWIGIKMKDQLQQSFSSGWPVVHTNWDETPAAFADGTCVVRRKSKSWDVASCSKKHPFICEASSVRRPALKNSFKESKCPVPGEDWWDVGGEYCYYMDTEKIINWHRANYECIRRGGLLAIFQSQEEVDALAPYIEDALLRSDSLYIGFYRSQVHENVFLWADRTQVNYTNWNNNTPDKKDEKCGELFPANMKWDDVKCDELKGYICSARKIPSKLEKMDTDCINSVKFKIVIGVFAGILLMVILVSVVCCFRAWKTESQNKATIASDPSRSSVTPILQETYEIDQV